MSEADVDGLFRDFDRDSSGAISFDEFARNLAPLMRQQGHGALFPHQRVRQCVSEELFQNFEADWAGKVEIEAFIRAFRTNPRFVHKVAHACRVSTAALTPAQLNDVFNELDGDYSGVLSFEEFAIGLEQVLPRIASGNVAKARSKGRQVQLPRLTVESDSSQLLAN